MRLNSLRFALLTALSPLLLHASLTDTWTGPDLPNGTHCTNTDPTCVLGGTTNYSIFSASLTSPMTSGGQWNLMILTDYPTNIVGMTSVPQTSYGDPLNTQFGMSDFIIQVGAQYYGIVLTAHDGYTAGDLYLASGIQTSGQVMAAKGIISPRPSLPSELAAGGSLQGAGSIAITSNGGNGISSALYKLSVNFAAPVTFLTNTTFTIYASSYVCDNGYLTGVGDPFTTPPPTGTPEPTTLLLLAPAIGALAWYKRRRQVV